MDNENRAVLGRQYLIEDVFESFDEYQAYLVEALSLFQDQIKKRSPTLKKYVPESLEVEFVSSIRAPRLYFPRYRGVIVVQLPSHGASPRDRAAIRIRMLKAFAAVVKINEAAVAEEIAMRMKLMRRKPRKLARTSAG